MKTKVPNITKKQLLPYIRKAWADIVTFLGKKRAELGPKYNEMNVYEQLKRRFCNPALEPEKIFDEYILCLNKVSRQPHVIREAVCAVGEMAVSLYLNKRRERLEKRREQRKKKNEENKQ